MFHSGRRGGGEGWDQGDAVAVVWGGLHCEGGGGGEVGLGQVAALGAVRTHPHVVEDLWDGCTLDRVHLQQSPHQVFGFHAQILESREDNEEP